MKHISVFTLAVLSFTASAQFPYLFEVDTAPYQSLLNSTLVPAGWDDPEFTADLGFYFDFNGINISQLTQYGSGTVVYSPTYPLSNGVIPISYDIADKGLVTANDPSVIRWTTSGQLGEQVFQLEWNNCGISQEINGGTPENLSYINVTLKMYEETGVIEFHYGPSQINPGIQEPCWSSLGYDFNYTTQEGQFVVTGGSSISPALSYYSSIAEIYSAPSLTSIPPNGTIYRFTPQNTGINDTNGVFEFLASPNPSNSNIKVSIPSDAYWTLRDNSGKTIHSGHATDDNILDFESLTPGTYFLSAPRYQTLKLIIL